MPAAARTRRASTPQTGRFTSTRAARAAGRRPTAPRRHGLAGGWLQRRQPQKQSAFKHAMSGLGAALPGRSKRASASSSKAGRRGGLVGGLAMLAGAAGLAFKNRDKVASMARRDHGRGAGAPPQH